MLRDMDYRLIESEMKRHNVEYIEEMELTYNYIMELFKHYDVHEYTSHFYDGMPDQCDECEKDSCDSCNVYKDYCGTEDQLSRETWVDVWGAGIWGESQRSVNNRVKAILLDILYNDDDKMDRLWINKENNYVNLFYYNRDRHSDNWFVFKGREL